MTQTFNNSGPGPKTLIGGNRALGFFGETTSSELITTEEFRTQVGLTLGINTTYPVIWLKFIIDNRITYVSKQPIIDSISYSNLKAKDLINGDTVREIKGVNYSIRVPRGSLLPYPDILSSSEQHPDTFDSEWNRMFYPIVDLPGVSDDGYAFGTFAKYTEDELGIGSNPSQVTICREVSGRDSGLIVTRGYRKATMASTSNPSTALRSYVFRPVIEAGGEMTFVIPMSFTDEDGVELGDTVDIGLKNSITIGFDVDLSEAGIGAKGDLYLNDNKIGEFSNTGQINEVDWYGGAGNPIFVNDEDVIKATLVSPIAKTLELKIIRLQPNLDKHLSLSEFIQAIKYLVPGIPEEQVIPEVIKVLGTNS